MTIAALWAVVVQTRFEVRIIQVAVVGRFYFIKLHWLQLMITRTSERQQSCEQFPHEGYTQMSSTDPHLHRKLTCNGCRAKMCPSARFLLQGFPGVGRDEGHATCIISETFSMMIVAGTIALLPSVPRCGLWAIIVTRLHIF